MTSEMINLYPYQNKVVKFMKEIEKDYRSGGMINLEMGLGKSFVSLGLIFDTIDEIKRTLIIVPKSLLHNWEKEFKRYQEGRPKINFKNYYGVNLEKERVLFYENIVLTTYDAVRMNNEYINAQFDRVILDESQNIRNHKNRISKQICELKAYKRWCLSGTPFYNNYSDMFAQCKFIQKKPYDNKKVWINPTQEFLEDFRKECCYILKKKDVFKKNEQLQLPPIEHKKIEIKLSDKERGIYNKLKTMLNEGGKNTLGNLIKIRQTCCNTSVMTKSQHTCSICSGFTLNLYKCGHYICDFCMDNKQRERKYMKKHKCDICKIESTKFDSIIKIINKMKEDEKMIVFTQWKNMANLLKKYLKKRKIKTHIIHGGVTLKKRNEMIEKYEDDNKKVLIATIQTCGVGINLTRANHVILIDNWWNESLERQAIDRLYRLGQKREVSVYHLVMKNTIERWINFKQKQKRIQNGILFEKDNKNHRRIGESYGIYSEKRRNKTNPEKLKSVSRFYSEKKMSSLMLSACLDRTKIIESRVKVSMDKVKKEFPILGSKLVNKPYTVWEIRDIAARKIQKFMKRMVMTEDQRVQVNKSLEKQMPQDVVDVVLDFLHTQNFRKYESF